jgi:hypothetical protein
MGLILGLIGILLGLLHLVLIIVAIVDIAASRMTMTAKALWVLVVLCFPVLGLIAYFVAGRGE